MNDYRNYIEIGKVLKAFKESKIDIKINYWANNWNDVTINGDATYQTEDNRLKDFLVEQYFKKVKKINTEIIELEFDQDTLDRLGKLADEHSILIDEYVGSILASYIESLQ